jgi:hypothetical protein
VVTWVWCLVHVRVSIIFWEANLGIIGLYILYIYIFCFFFRFGQILGFILVLENERLITAPHSMGLWPYMSGWLRAMNVTNKYMHLHENLAATQVIEMDFVDRDKSSTVVATGRICSVPTCRLQSLP